MSTLKFKTSLDSTQYDKGVENIKSRTGGLTSAFARAKGMIGGALAIGAVIAFVQGMKKLTAMAFEYGSALYNISLQTGITVEGMQGFERAISKTGGSSEKLQSALRKLQDVQVQALSGDEKAIQSFKDLGISMDDVAKMNPEQMFKAMSNAMHQGGSSAQELNAAATILGRENLPFVKQAMLDIGKAGGELEQGFFKVSDASAAALATMKSSWANFWTDMKQGATNAVGAVVNSMAKVFLRRDFAAEGLKSRADAEKNAQQQRQLDLKTLEDKGKKEKQLANERKKDLSSYTRETDRIEDDVAKKFAESTAKGDKFAAIGGRLGGFESQQLQLARQQVEIAKRTEEYLAKIAENTKDGTGLA
jgi:hypothetical protein